MGTAPGYFIVEAGALPEVFLKVAEAKRLLETGEAGAVNQAVRRDAPSFMGQCDQAFQDKVNAAADLICRNRKDSPVVLLSGPSGSGKTTTAGMICLYLTMMP